MKTVWTAARSIVLFLASLVPAARLHAAADFAEFARRRSGPATQPGLLRGVADLGRQRQRSPADLLPRPHRPAVGKGLSQGPFHVLGCGHRRNEFAVGRVPPPTRRAAAQARSGLPRLFGQRRHLHACAGDVGFLRGPRAAHPHRDASPRGASNLPVPVGRGPAKDRRHVAPRRASGHFAGLSHGGRRRHRPGPAAGSGWPDDARASVAGRRRASLRCGLRVVRRRGVGRLPQRRPTRPGLHRAREDALRIDLYEERPRPLGRAGFPAGRLAQSGSRTSFPPISTCSCRGGWTTKSSPARRTRAASPPGPLHGAFASAGAWCCCSENRRRRRASSG